MDLSFFLEPPELTAKGKLIVEALKPLSMTTAQPGTYYRSQPAPTEPMLYGMLENALGWHFPQKVRKGILKGLRKAAKEQLEGDDPRGSDPWITGSEDQASGSSFQSLLQHHLKFPASAPRFEPATTSFDDLWARHLRRGDSFIGGSRHNDSRVDFLLKAIERGEASYANKGKADVLSAEDVLQLEEVEQGTKVYEGALRPFFPQYYVSPTPREYVIPSRPYQYRAEATQAVADLVTEALRNPAAPLYLGTNDGWVDARWETIHE